MLKKILVQITAADRYFLLPLAISITAILFLAFIFLIFFNIMPNRIPLFYSLSWGENQLANREQFFILPVTMFLILLINSTFAWYLHPQQSFLKKMLLLSIIPLNIVILITGLKIIKIFV